MVSPNRSAEPVTCLSILSPGVLGPEYFREIAVLVSGGPPGSVATKAVTLRYGLIPAPRVDQRRGIVTFADPTSRPPPKRPMVLHTGLLLVVAAALVDVDGRVLIAQRPPGKSLAGLWEFPGGKVMTGERPEAALIRELDEELGIAVAEACLAPLTFASHSYAEFHLLMPVYVCRRWQGFVAAREGQALKWVRPRDLRDHPMPPADIPLIPPLIDLLGP